MATATQRIPVLVTVTEKIQIAKRAKNTGLSMGEFLRRAAAAFRPAQDDTALEGMIDQMLKTTKAANRALDNAMAYVEESNRRIIRMEEKQNEKVI